MNRDRWNKQRSKILLQDIHKNSNNLASKVSTAYGEAEMALKAKVTADLPLLPKCWKYKDSEIHRKIKEIYSLCEVFESNETLATSCNTYVRTVLSDRKLLESAGFDSILSCLAISKRISIKLGIEQGRELEVEREIREANETQNEFKSILEKKAVTFVEESNIFPITIGKDYPGARPRFDGVYLIYYVGQTSPYGDRVKPSQVQPIYVGKSNTDILGRLDDHLLKITRAKDLKVTDFVVRFMRMDIKIYVRAIEDALIEYYDPLWNNKSVKFSFGNAKDPNNNWYAYHVDKVKRLRREMMKRIRVYKKHQ